MISNARHTFRDSDGGEAAATIESIVSNARQLRALGDGDGGEAVTFIVFATSYYSIFCA